MTGLVDNINENNFLRQIESTVQWCRENNLKLNVSKTKELVIDFRRGEVPPPPLVIAGDTVERVDSFKFLGTILSSTLSWELNSNNIYKKARQRMYFLRKLRSFKVNKVTLINFYRAIVESILTQSIIVWFDRTAKKDMKRLNSIVINAQKLIGVNLPSLESLYEERMSARTEKILKDDTHPARKYFDFLPHGRR